MHFTGCAGQSFGAFLAPGVTFELVGEANDFVGKGLSGGKIIVRPPDHISYVPSDNVIAGNVIGYGATSGSIFLHGQAGERFAIRNSGAKMVVEGIGDHGCEYMTGGRVAVLGKVGVNFAAGMTGGLAYVYDADNNFDQKCNLGGVDLETVMPHSADEAELLQLIYEHYMATRSRRAYDLLNNWPEERQIHQGIPGGIPACPGHAFLKEACGSFLLFGVRQGPPRVRRPPFFQRPACCFMAGHFGAAFPP